MDVIETLSAVSFITTHMHSHALTCTHMHSHALTYMTHTQLEFHTKIVILANVQLLAMVLDIDDSLIYLSCVTNAMNHLGVEM